MLSGDAYIWDLQNRFVRRWNRMIILEEAFTKQLNVSISIGNCIKRAMKKNTVFLVQRGTLTNNHIFCFKLGECNIILSESCMISS